MSLKELIDEANKSYKDFGNLMIAYGTETITLNKGDQHMLLTNEDLAFIVQSALKNITFQITHND